VIGTETVNRLEHDILVEISPVTGIERRRGERRRVDVDVAVERRRADRRRGRPSRVDGQRALRRIEFRLTEQENAGLEAAARDNGTTVAALIRDAVNEFVADYAEHRRPFVR
jgi:hypothetical protein